MRAFRAGCRQGAHLPDLQAHVGGCEDADVVYVGLLQLNSHNGQSSSLSAPPKRHVVRTHSISGLFSHSRLDRMILSPSRLVAFQQPFHNGLPSFSVLSCEFLDQNNRCLITLQLILTISCTLTVRTPFRSTSMHVGLWMLHDTTGRIVSGSECL